VRQAAVDVRERIDAPGLDAGLTSTTVTSGARPARIVALHAVPVRRSLVDLRTLLESTITVMERQARAIGAALTLDVEPELTDAPIGSLLAPCGPGAAHRD
jgi:hypothetical protein